MRLFDYQRATRLMEHAEVDLLLGCTRHSVGYLSDYWDEDLDEHHNMWYPDVAYAQMCGISREEAKSGFLVLPAINATSVAAQDPWIQDRRIWGPGNYIRNWQSGRPDGGNPMDDVVAAIHDRGLAGGRIAVERRYLPVEYFDRLRAGLPNATFVDGRQILTQLRAVKGDEEIHRIRETCRRASRVMNRVTGDLREGMTAEDLRWKWIEAFAEERMTWARGVIYFGPAGTTLKQGPPMPTGNPLRKGHAVRADICGRYRGYVNDMSRVVAFGPVDPGLERVHAEVRQILEGLVEAVKPGITFSELRALELQMYSDAGYGPSVSFGGHSFGRSIHEWPYMEDGEETRLEPGMVLTIEPQVMFSKDGDINVSLEDDILVTADGCENLTAAASLDLYRS